MKTLRYIVAILILAAAGCDRVQVGFTEDRDVCIGNLHLLECAKEMWAKEYHKTTNDVPGVADLLFYVKKFPTCPDGGAYAIGRVGKNPTCSIKGHELPPPSAH